METQPNEPTQARPPSWRPLTPPQRRVVGVLVEKAKTTPDAYPLTLNALTTGCNQKSNRNPQMQLTPDAVEETLESLREMGAVAEVQGGGRVSKYRHYLYEWLGVDKVEIAVMAELLLRGPQTVGELRGRAARMEPIPDLSALQPILRSLIEKGLVIELTPPGRGQIITHALYPEAELAQLRARYSASSRAAAPAAGPSPAANSEPLEQIRRQIEQLRQDVQQLSQRIDQIETRPS